MENKRKTNKIIFRRTFLNRAVILISVLLLMASCNEGVQLYVSPDGNDADAGVVNKPLRTLEGARKDVRAMRTAYPGKKVTVYFKDGIYPLEQTVRLTAEDSGSEQAPVVYRAMKGETPIFTGGKALTQWTRLKDAPELERLAPPVRDKIYVSDLAVAGVTDFGDPTGIGQRPELICNGQLQTLTRWPDKGFVKAGAVRGEKVLKSAYSLTWNAVYGTDAEGVVFEYLDDYQDRWAQEDDIRLGGYWCWDWQDEYQKVARWDAGTRTVRLGEPYHGYGYRDSLRYFGLNLFCEINRPGNWYLNRSTGKLYWYPPEGVEPEKAEVSLTCFNAPFMVELKDCEYITFEGLTFREGRGSAVGIAGGTHNLLSDCCIERFGMDGVHINGGTYHGVTGCSLSDFGHGGINITGGDRKTLTPCEHFVEHTIVENFSLFQRTYAPAVYMDGCGIRVAHNRFRYSSSSAISIAGNDFVIEYNEISRVVEESDDQGGLDTPSIFDPSQRGVVIRYNRWSDIAGGTRHSAAGVRFDDMISGMLVYGNLFERCGVPRHSGVQIYFGGVQIHGGKDNRIENNVFYECTYAVTFSTWGEKRWLQALDGEITRKKIYSDVDINSEIYLQKYPELKDIRLNVDVNSVTDNLMVSCKQMFRDLKDNKAHNNTELEAGGKPVETFCTKEELAKYGLRPIPVDEIGPKKNRWIH